MQPAANGLYYIGDCEWKPSGNPEICRPPNALPTVREPWIGRSDKIDAWQAAYRVGASYLGGYIIDNTPRDNTPFPGVASADLIVALPPDFHAFLVRNSFTMKTAAKSAEITGNAVIPNSVVPDGATVPNPVACTLEVGYLAPESAYTYFASEKPDGPRYSKMGTATEASIRRSRYRASLSSGEVVFRGGHAPVALVSALAMSARARVSSHDSEQIPGTPWWRCTDVVALELVGDDG